VRVPDPAVRRVLETLRERHFQRKVEVISTIFLISPDGTKPKSEFLPGFVLAFVHRTDQQRRQPSTERTPPQCTILVRVPGLAVASG
jgi:hypothetical protein